MLFINVQWKNLHKKNSFLGNIIMYLLLLFYVKDNVNKPIYMCVK